MTDYSKLKVTDLKDLLSARSLPVSGKKEELIARLTESDAANPSADDLGDLAPPEEEYDWDTPATKTYSTLGESHLNKSAAKSETKPAVAPAPVPSAAPKQRVEAPKPAATTTATSPPAPGPTDAPAVSAADTAATDAALAEELEKRRRRAERFGIPLAESAKALERAKRFGARATGTDEAKKAARGKKFGNQVWTNNGNAKNGEANKPVEKKTPAPPKKTIMDDPVEAEKAKKRAERFGGGNEAKKVKS